MKIIELCEVAIIEAVRIWVTFLYVKIFFTRRTSRCINLFLGVLSFLLSTIAYIFFENIIVNIIVTLFVCLIISQTGIGSVQKKIFFSLSITGVSIAIDFIVGYVFMEIPSANDYDFIVSAISVMVFLLSSVFVSRLVRTRTDVFSQQFSGMIIILIASIGTMFILSQDSSVSRGLVLFIGVAFLITDFIIFYLYDVISTKFVVEQEKNQIYNQMLAYEKQLRLNIENDKIVRSIRHDMINHLAGIYNYLKTGSVDKAKEYIEVMEEKLSETRNYVNSGVIGIDSILNYKISEALRQGIDVMTDISIPEELNFKEFDLNIIIGNLMDNAIEAAEKINENVREPIRVNIKCMSGCLVIKIDNQCIEADLNIKDGTYISTKTDKLSLHGYGLKNVNNVVNQNDGIIETKSENDRFFVQVTMPVQENISICARNMSIRAKAID